MAQLDAAAVAEADVVETAPENSQDIDTTEAESPTDAESLYGDDQPETVEESLDEADGDQVEAVSAPASLNQEEKDQFAQLQPEAQRALSEILSRRDRETQQGLEAARSAQREAQRTAADQVANAQRQHAQQLSQIVQAFAPQPPSVELAREDPGEYAYQKALYDQSMGQFNQLIGSITSLNTEADQHSENRKREWLQEQVNQLRSIPEYADDATRPQFLAGLTEVGRELGFTDEDLADVSAKDVFALHKVRQLKIDADKWRAHQKKRNERPRAVGGRFAAAPAGRGAAPVTGVNDTLKTLYPND